MKRNDYIGIALFTFGIILIGYLINNQVGNGLVLGALFGFLHYFILRQFYTLILAARTLKMGLFALYFIGNLGVFAVPLYIGCIYPEFVNVFGAAFGLTIHNLYIYGKTLLQNIKKERRDEIRQI